MTTNNDWEERFSTWWSNHDDFMGGLSSNLVGDLKDFIRKEKQASYEQGVRDAIGKLPEDMSHTAECDEGYNYCRKLAEERMKTLLE